MIERKLIENDLAERLVKVAVDSVNYVALGDTLAREIAEKYDLPPERAKNLACVMAARVADHLTTFRF